MDPLATIQRLGQGRVLEDLAAALARTAEEVRETGQPGSVTLKLTIERMPQGGDRALSIKEALSRSAPKRKPRGAIFFLVDGELQREDTRQERLPFRAVETDDPNVRESGDHTAAVREA